MIDLTPMLQAVIGLVAALITAYLIPWIKSKTTENQQTTLKLVMNTLVYAAEQIYKGNNRGEEKLRWVQSELLARGFKVDMAAIEAEVAKLNIDKAMFDIGEVKLDE